MKILVVVLQLLAVIGGVGIGVAWRIIASGDEPVHEDGTVEAASAEALSANTPKKEAKVKHDQDKGPDGKGGHGKGADAHGGHGKGSDGAGFVRFGRQFIVPVYRKSGPNALVVVELNLEVPPPRTEFVYAQEPRLRDALFSALIELSNEGAFDGRIIEAANMDRIRARLLDGARRVIGDDAQGVLILGITRQNV